MTGVIMPCTVKSVGQLPFIRVGDAPENILRYEWLSNGIRMSFELRSHL